MSSNENDPLHCGYVMELMLNAPGQLGAVRIETLTALGALKIKMSQAWWSILGNLN